MPATDPDFTRYRATGDAPAFRALVEAHLPMVHAVAMRRLGPHAHLAPDVAQAVFTRLARCARGLPPDLVTAPWLHRQAVRLAIDTVRKEERRRIRETTAAMLHAPDPTPDSPAAALLDEALDALPAADRSLLVLRYLEDRDFDSVAQSLGSTPEAARKRIARSLEKLRALLTRRGAALSTAGLMAFLSEQTRAAAPAAMAARISTTALQSAGAGRASAILASALMSHATALTTGALAALLACGLFYQQLEKQIAQSAARGVVRSGESDRSDQSDPSDSSSAPLPSTLPEIIAALKDITNGPDTRASRERISRLLRRVTPEQYLEFYVSAEPRIHPLRWRSLVRQSARLWKDTDPAAVTRSLFTSDNRKTELTREVALHRNMTFNSFEISTNREGGSSANALIKEILIAWLDRDFAAAREWFQSVRSEPLMIMPWRHGNLAEKLAPSVAERLPHDGSLAALPTAGLTNDQTTVLRAKWADHILNSSPDMAAALATRAADSEEARLLAHYAAMRDPEACQRAIAALPDAGLRYAAALGFVSQHGVKGEDSFTSYDANDRLPRARFAFEQAAHMPAGDALKDIVLASLEAGTQDSELVRAWAIAAGGANAGPALAAAARRMAAETWSMPMAVEWAAAIPDAAQRGPLLRGIFLRWSDAAPEAAQEFLTKAAPELAAELAPIIVP